MCHRISIIAIRPMQNEMSVKFTTIRKCYSPAAFFFLLLHWILGCVRVTDRGSEGESQVQRSWVRWGESGLEIVGQRGRVRVRDRGSEGGE